MIQGDRVVDHVDRRRRGEEEPVGGVPPADGLLGPGVVGQPGRPHGRLSRSTSVTADLLSD
jgi:hypothetical protein